MERGQAAGDVDQLMEPNPALVAELADRVGRRRQRKRQHQNEGREADSDEWPVGDVRPDRAEIEELIQHEIRQEVERRVEEGEETELPSNAGRPRPVEQ